MALTAFPTITFNAGSGSDTAASGAGPATAVTGTATATNSTTVTLTVGAGTLSDVAEDGSAVLQIDGVGFVRISTRDTGAVTVLVENAVTCTAANFAIGGKRATLNHTESRRLFAATSTPTAVGATGGWTISLEDAQTITSAITLAATAGSGMISIVSSSAGTLRTLTQSTSANHFSANTANRWRFTDIQFQNSHGTPLEVFTSSSSAFIEMRNCVAGDSGGSNCPKGLWIRTSSSASIVLYNTSVLRCTSLGINGATNVALYASEISRCGGAGISNAGNTLLAHDSIISHNSGDGITCSFSGGTLTFAVKNSVIHGNTGDGIELTGTNLASFALVNNQITANGGYGLKCSGTAPHTGFVEYNNFGNAGDSTNNTSGSASGITLSGTNTTSTAGYTDASSSVRNFKVGSNGQGTGFPASSSTVGAGQTGTTCYADMGLPTHAVATGGSVGVIGG